MALVTISMLKVLPSVRLVSNAQLANTVVQQPWLNLLEHALQVISVLKDQLQERKAHAQLAITVLQFLRQS